MNRGSPSKTSVAVGLSGGVDSAVTARLLCQAGYEVLGLTMQIWDGPADWKEEERPACYGPGEAADIAAARRVAHDLGIAHHVVPLATEYRSAVLEYFRREYLGGRTPNPCVACNRAVKFGALLDRARESGILFDFFATGHYARVEYDPCGKRHLLRRGLDDGKDQSYFVSQLSQAQLAQVMFPLGTRRKEEVRAIARAAGWHDLADKAESQDFIEAANYSVLFKEDEYRSGPIVDHTGRCLGEHEGIVRYTIGQRRGLRIGGAAEPLYVTGIDAAANTIRVGPQADLLAKRLRVTAINWIASEAVPAALLSATVKIRQQHKGAAGSLTTESDGSLLVDFQEPQLAITPGQTAVFYDGDLVLGSGIIAGTVPESAAGFEAC